MGIDRLFCSCFIFFPLPSDQIGGGFLICYFYFFLSFSSFICFLGVAMAARRPSSLVCKLHICVLFRCVLHPLPLPLSSCLGCIPPLIGLPSLRFYAVGSSLFLLSVCFCLCSLFYRDDAVLCWLLLARPFLYAFHAHLRFPV